MSKNAQDFRKQKAVEKLKKRLKKDKVSEEQILQDRKVTIQKTEVNISCLEKEIEYKENQLEKGIIEKNESTLYNLASFPKDEVKPRFVLDIEISMMKQMLIEKEESLKIMKELEKENGNKPS